MAGALDIPPATATAVAQTPRAPAFDVVSIKPNHSGQATGGPRAAAGGRFEMINVTIGTVVSAAYQRAPFDNLEVVAAPDWLDRDRFDIIAQTAAGTGGPGLTSELLAMLRTMLADRFQLATHWEKRDRDVYALVLVRPGASTGPGLKRADAGCGEGAAAPLTGGGRANMRPGRGPSCTFGGGPGNLQGNAVTLEMLGGLLGRSELRRPVIDRTGLTGSFDVDLRYRPDLGVRPDGPPPAPPDPDAPSIFTAVEEQLGLKLVSDRAALDVLVIDRVERPSPD
jgi:uncharacterized protein (TIGR03435 family)